MKLFCRFKKKKRSCCRAEPTIQEAKRKVAIVGNPNVGKSVLFGALTGAYVNVSNYPGTTVEVSRGKMRLGEEIFEVVDTPGMYSLSPITEEERVARAMLMNETHDVVIHVVEAKNLGRMLPFTLQLIEAGLPLILVVNVMDEALRLGMTIDCEQLEKELGFPVVPTVSITGEGIDLLRERISEKLGCNVNCDSQEIVQDNYATKPATKLEESPAPLLPKTAKDALARNGRLSVAAEKIAGLLKSDYGISAYSIAKLLLAQDEDIFTLVRDREYVSFDKIQQEIQTAREGLAYPPSYSFWLRRQTAANQLVEKVTKPPTHTKRRTSQVLSDLMIRPITGFPILLAVLYLGLYVVVGKLGAGLFVDFLDEKVFEGYINPFLTKLAENHIPWPVLQDLFVHDYGIFTMGLKYAVAIILPIVAIFFLVFSIIEDSGYLPRLALLIDRAFKAIGLSGRAVIPLALGFGCDSMATLVTRVLETRRERIIATLLLALAVPCSAQLGIILGLLSGNPKALIVWAMVVSMVFIAVGYLSARILRGEKASFYIEVPPLRVPQIRNVLAKTYARMECYFLEILPLFLAVSVLIWLGEQIRFSGKSLFQWILQGMSPLVQAIGLPQETAGAFLFGFFRRDYGAAGLYDLHSQGILTGVPLLVAMVTITLFIPCVAQWLIMYRERGWKTTLAICAFIFPFAWIVGYLLFRIFTSLGISL